MATRYVSALTWLVPVIVALAIGGHDITRKGMYSVEEATMWIGRMHTHRIFTVLSYTDAVHGFYYLSIHALFTFVHPGVVIMRLPSLVATGIAVAVTVSIARYLTQSRTVAFLSGLLTAVMPLVTFHSVSARSFAIDAMLVLGATRVLLWALDADSAGERRRRWLLYGVLVVLAGYLHEMTMLAVISHAVTLAVARVGWRNARAWAITSAVALIALIPIIVISHSQQNALSWIHRPGWPAIRRLISDFFGPSLVSMWIIAALMLVGLLWPGPGRGRVGLRSLAVPLFLLPSTLLLVQSQIGTPLYGGSRYVFYSLPPALILASAGLDRVMRSLGRAHAWRQAVVAVVVLGSVVAAVLPRQRDLHTAAGYDMDELSVARYVAEYSLPSDGVLYMPAGTEMTPLGYPYQFRNLTDLSAAVSPNKANKFYGIPNSRAALRASMRQHHRIWLIGRIGHYSGRYGVELTVICQSFLPVRGAKFHGIEAQLYVHHPAGTPARSNC